MQGVVKRCQKLIATVLDLDKGLHRFRGGTTLGPTPEVRHRGRVPRRVAGVWPVCGPHGSPLSVVSE